MAENKTKSTLMKRLKKAVTNPFVMGAIAGISYFSGLKQGGNSNDQFEGMREAMGGKITHAVLKGVNGTKAEYFLEGESLHRIVMKDTNGMETRAAYDSKTGDGASWSSNGTTMRTEGGQWVEADLTEAQHAIVNGAYDSYLEEHKGSLTKGQEALVNGSFDAYLMSYGKQK